MDCEHNQRNGRRSGGAIGYPAQSPLMKQLPEMEKALTGTVLILQINMRLLPCLYHTIEIMLIVL
ncbi:hypothetical protein SDC9_83526 [bioreactor metagenome]|uniref:Uncharacterized protein n=1 Tax=bioreactor metagenome TaxID=1076179 RepID=A0A644Z804_9ZZZZ